MNILLRYVLFIRDALNSKCVLFFNLSLSNEIVNISKGGKPAININMFTVLLIGTYFTEAEIDCNIYLFIRTILKYLMYKK